MSTTTSACTQPGCTGHILDGYCDVCGSPPSLPPPLPPSGTPHGAPGGGRAGTRGHRRRRRPPGSATRPRPPPAPPTGWRPPRSARPGPGGGGTGVTRRVGTSSTRLRGARLGAGLTTVPADPRGRRGQGDPEGPAGPRGQAGLPVLRRRRSGAPATASPGAPRASARKCRNPFSFTPKLQAGDLVGRPVRGGRLPRPRRPRLDLPRPRPQRLRPLGGAQGPAQLRRPRRRWPPRSPSGSSSPRSSTR